MHRWTVLQSSGIFFLLKGRSLRLQVTLVAARRWNSLRVAQIIGEKRNVRRQSPPQGQKSARVDAEGIEGKKDEVYLSLCPSCILNISAGKSLKRLSRHLICLFHVHLSNDYNLQFCFAFQES